MREIRFVPTGSTAFAVKFNENEAGRHSGRFLSPLTGEVYEFSSLSAMVLMMDEELDAMENATGDFFSPSPPRFDTDLKLDVLFRQHHSWQGKVKWTKQNVETTFKSVLDLLIMFETVLSN